MKSSFTEADETHTSPNSNKVAGQTTSPEQSPYDAETTAATITPIDKLVFSKLKKLGIPPAKLCSDSVFVRRIFLDLIGTLPEPEEARAFLGDETPGKRGRLIDKLLEREEFNDYWANKWSDLFRIKSEFPINLWPLAATSYHQWIRDRISANYPYDRFVRDLLTSSGSNFKVPPSNFYRAVTNKKPNEIAKAVALTFMGVRAEKWSAAKLNGMAEFFTQIEYKSTGEWKEEIVCWDPSKEIAWGLSGGKVSAVYPDGKKALFTDVRDPREYFADWLISPNNPYFARNICNRIWYWIMGRGIINGPDDIRPDNPPQNAALLTYLENELVSSGWNLRHIYKIIVSSSVYQLSSVYNGKNEEAASANFAKYTVRRLDAEVLLDAINQITGGTETYSSQTPEPYTWLSTDIRAICLPDGSITSPFLEMFGRPPRDTGLESERINLSTSQQRLHMLNSSHIQQKIEKGPKLQPSLNSPQPLPQVVDDLYLRILSRRPTVEETAIALGYASKEKRKRNCAVDIAWATINSSEFLYRH